LFGIKRLGAFFVIRQHASTLTGKRLQGKRNDQALRSEINTLGYPKAALLCFSIGVVLYNTMSVLKSAIRAEHPDAPPLSGYYLAEEISATHLGMLIAIPRPHWTRTFARLSSRQMASTLQSLAAKVDPTRFRKNTRGPKQPPPKRTVGLKEKHVSTARSLAERIK
jgi:hypothetical protein